MPCASALRLLLPAEIDFVKLFFVFFQTSYQPPSLLPLLLLCDKRCEQTSVALWHSFGYRSCAVAIALCFRRFLFFPKNDNSRSCDCFDLRRRTPADLVYQFHRPLTANLLLCFQQGTEPPDLINDLKSKIR